MGDHPTWPVLPLGLIGLAVTCALPVQNVQAALCLLCTGLHHDQGLPLPDRFGIRAHLAIGDPEVKKPALEILPPSSALQTWRPRCADAGATA